MLDIKPFVLIHHSIDLTADAKSVYQPIKRYTPKERAFAAKIFPEMEAAEFIMRAASDWGARSQFPPKKEGSDDLRVVHNFIPFNTGHVCVSHEPFDAICYPGLEGS